MISEWYLISVTELLSCMREKSWKKATAARFFTGKSTRTQKGVFSYEDALRIIEEHAADYLNIKLMKTGGIHEALRICDAAERYGVKCMIGCMLESKVSVSAGAHLAAAKGCITMADLDGPSLCRTDPYQGGPEFEGPVIRMNESFGIGITSMPVTFDGV